MHCNDCRASEETGSKDAAASSGYLAEIPRINKGERPKLIKGRIVEDYLFRLGVLTKSPSSERKQQTTTEGATVVVVELTEFTRRQGNLFDNRPTTFADTATCGTP